MYISKSGPNKAKKTTTTQQHSVHQAEDIEEEKANYM